MASTWQPQMARGAAESPTELWEIAAPPVLSVPMKPWLQAAPPLEKIWGSQQLTDIHIRTQFHTYSCYQSMTSVTIFGLQQRHLYSN